MDRGKGVPKEREVNRRREVFEDYRSVIDVKVDTQDCVRDLFVVLVKRIK